ncbi:MAG: DNA-3-methyladenine glycosylase [Patescibacteria group bacterium]
MRLKRDFFAKETIWVAKNLLGKYLVRRLRGKKQLVGKIVETEAYIGPDDKASHAAFRKTKRCAPMYDKPGTAYVYFIYGMYWMLNIVTEEKGKPCAVLVRAIEPIENEKIKMKNDILKFKKLGSGPGLLCKWLAIDGSFNGEDLVKSQRLWLEEKGDRVRPCQIVATKRIGVEYAGPWKDKPWRFYLKKNPYVSRKGV